MQAKQFTVVRLRSAITIPLDEIERRFNQAIQTAMSEDDTLAGKSTLCRMEQRVDRQSAVKAHKLLWHHFIEQHDEPPKEIVLDFDDTDVPVHGDQPGKFFNASYCNHPLISPKGYESIYDFPS